MAGLVALIKQKDGKAAGFLHPQICAGLTLIVAKA
jgi:hypothetical protein